MSLIYGYSKTISDNKALGLAYERLAISCGKNGEMANDAMKKANSASYRARKADEAAVGAAKAAKAGDIKTFTGEIEITHYGNPRTVKPFRTGIILLGIITNGNPNGGDTVQYDFYDITGNKHISTIHGRQKYRILKSSDDVSNIQDVYTSLKPCSISINLKGKDIKSNKPSKPVKLKITIQYIELSGGVSEIEKNGMLGM